MHSDLALGIHLLESENEEQGFRYFVRKSASMPEITYLREVVDELMAFVNEEVKRRPSAGLNAKGVFNLTFHKPVKKSLS